MKVNVCIIATRRYKEFIPNLVESIKKHFLLRHNIEIVIFTDDIHAIDCQGDERVTIIKDLIVSWGFPFATLYRYSIMVSRTYNSDYLYYMDADMLIVDEVDEEIFGNIVAIKHPGFFSGVNGPGSWCDDKLSNAYTFPENRRIYAAGGVQGGQTEQFYRLMKRLAWEIQDDEKRGVKCEWNDEQHFNRAISEMGHYKVLNPTFCMVEQTELRKLWKIDHLPVKILALAKDHKEFQQ